MEDVLVPDYVRATSLEEALACLAASRFEVLCGGTDFYPARADQPITEPVLDISAIAALRRIERLTACWRIGAAATWSDILEHAPGSALAALREAAREIGGVQIQNAASIGGNVCNASPAADGIVALLALDARVILESLRGRRELTLPQFLLGSRRTARAADELVIGFDVPRRSAAARSVFKKLGHRKYLVISVAMVALLIDRDEEQRVSTAGIAVGSCSATAQRLPRLEAKLIGSGPNEDLSEAVEASDLAPLSPIDDVRGTGRYRTEAVLTLLRRALRELSR